MQQVVQGPPVEQYAQRTSDTFNVTTVYACTASGCYAFFDTSATLSKHLHESHRALELGIPLNVAGVNSVEEMRTSTTPAEFTHDYMQPHPPDKDMFPYVPSSSRGYDSLRSPPSLGPVHPRKGNEYMVRTRFVKVANELIHERAVVGMNVLTSLEQKVGLPKVQQEHLALTKPTIDCIENTVSDDRTVATSREIPLSTPDLR